MLHHVIVSFLFIAWCGFRREVLGETTLEQINVEHIEKEREDLEETKKASHSQHAVNHGRKRFLVDLHGPVEAKLEKAIRIFIRIEGRWIES